MNILPDIYEVWFAGLKHLSCQTKLGLLEIFKDAESIYNAKSEDITDALYDFEYVRNMQAAVDEIFDKDIAQAKANIARCKSFGACGVFISSEMYPMHLRNIPDPPVLFWCKGNIELLKNPGVAIVGTRRCSPYGRWAATEISKRVAGCGCTVVSGMAAGIDSAAHAGALNVNGNTIAVFGTGLDICFPKSNQALYEQISAKGLIVSEYNFADRGFPGNFPLRNRIISGLSSKMVVVEGGVKSGSMISAGLAAEQGRDVFAVPGNINQPNSIGVNKLIADGATPIMELDDIPGLLGLRSKAVAENVARLSFEEDKLYTLISEAPGCGTDYIQLCTGYRPALISGLISAMELKGLVRREGSLFFVK